MTAEKVNNFNTAYLTNYFQPSLNSSAYSTDIPLFSSDNSFNQMFSNNTDMFDYQMPALNTGMDYNFMPQNNSFNFTMPNIDFSQFNIGNMFGSSNINTSAFVNQFYNNFTASLSQKNKNWMEQINNMFTMFGPQAANLNNVTYNQQKAQQIASNALTRAGSHSTKQCAKYVNDAMEYAGLDFSRGHAYQMIDNLRNSKDFKEVSITKDQLASLPAGCILVYPRGAAGYSSEYGHIEITLGDGRAASDFVNSNPKYSNQMKVFVPV